MGDDTVSDENRKLEIILDAVDRRTAHQQTLHNLISDGFMALARERYANPSSSESKQLANIVHGIETSCHR